MLLRGKGSKWQNCGSIIEKKEISIFNEFSIHDFFCLLSIHNALEQFQLDCPVAVKPIENVNGKISNNFWLLCFVTSRDLKIQTDGLKES